jgi:bifunctional lysine-specific demethylase and histidyl-hydroxylase NO66
VTVSDVTDGRATLCSIVGDGERFLADTFGRTPWTGSAASLDALFTVDDVDKIVASSVRAPAIRMVRGGERIPPSEFCSSTRIGSTTLGDTADARKVLDQFRRGATLVLQSLQRTWPPLIAWCCALERELGWPVQANAYLTPAHECGLARHADGHDVFAVQLHGSKWWDVDGIGGVCMAPGDVLYMPSGTHHVAETRHDPSLHLTLGVHRPDRERIERAALDIARQRLEGRLDDGANDDGNIEHLADELRAVSVREALERLRRPPRVTPLGELAASIRRGTVDRSDRIAARHPWELVELADAASLYCSSGRLHLPSRATFALRQLSHARGRAVEVGALAGLEPDEQLVLARRLLDEGAVDLIVDVDL